MLGLKLNHVSKRGPCKTAEHKALLITVLLQACITGNHLNPITLVMLPHGYKLQYKLPETILEA